MKFQILPLLSLFLFCGQLTAQSPDLAAVATTERISPAPADLARAHDRLAIRQISEHLAENIRYPEAMAPFALSGTLTLRVQLNKNGKITAVSVLETDLPADFSDTGIKIMRELKRLQLNKRPYHGAPSVIVPIRFSL